MANLRLSKQQAQVILAISIGNILEWFEVYSYAYLVPVLSKVFFDFYSFIVNWFSAFLVFGSGFITRPVGAIIFGRIGDLIGRKRAFVLSIVVMTIPTFLMGCLPTYAQVGLVAPFLLIFLRLLQSIPAAGEVPGSGCFLYEYANPTNRRFITSWTGVGNQIGAIVAIVETFFMNRFLSEEFILSWGWRISFWSGGFIGLFGIYLRNKLHETPSFRDLKVHHKLDKETVAEVIHNYRKQVILGTLYGVINAATFYLIAAYIPTYFDEALRLSPNQNISISLFILVFTTIFLPVFGFIGDRYDNKTIFISCSIIIIVLLYPLYWAINTENMLMLASVAFLYLIPITCITALIPYLLLNLFPTPIRFTGAGLAYNLADGIVGGFTPAIVLLLLQFTGDQGAFCWYILFCAIISLIAYTRIRK